MTDKGKKILYGVLGAIGGVVVLCIAVIIAFSVWVTRPGELIDPGRLLSADATGYAEWTLSLDDPGTEGFVNLLIDAAQEMPDGAANALQPFIGSWIRGAQEAWAQRELEKAFPMLAAWTLHPGSETSDSDLHLVSVSAEGLGNQLVLADWIAGLVLGRAPNTSVHRYRGEKIYEVNDRGEDFEATFFARRGAIFAASDVDTARQAVDLLAEPDTADRPETELARLYAGTVESDALRAAVTNPDGEIARIFERLSGKEIKNPDGWQLIKGLSLTGGLQADGAFAATFKLITDDPILAATDAPAIETAFFQNFEGFPLALEFQAVPIDNGIQIDIRISDLVESLTTWMREQGFERRGPGRIDIEIEIDSN
jgi:hypothetical protein